MPAMKLFILKTAWLGGSAAALLSALGCSRQPAQPSYTTLTGVVEAVHADSGELVVRTPSLRPAAPERSLVCSTTNAEVYINDRFSQLAAISQGDAIELVGYHDPDPHAARFIVSFAYITHNEPTPKAPLSVAAPPDAP
jgi:hypothetical protein